MYARQRGIAEAKFEYISYIVEVNCIKSDWINTVLSVFTILHQVCRCGGEISEATEIEPPSWFENVKMSYAVGRQGEHTGDITDTRGHIWGAGMSFRKSAYEAIVHCGFSPILSDRQGKKLLAGGDTEIAYNFRLAGWRLWFDERLQLQHFLPKSRLEWPYLMNLYKGFGYSHVVFEIYHMTLYNIKNPVISHLFVHQIRIFCYFLTWRLKHLFSGTEGMINRLHYQLYLSGLFFLIRNTRKVKNYHNKIESVASCLQNVMKKKSNNVNS